MYKLPSSLESYSLYLRSNNTIVRNAFDSKVGIVASTSYKWDLLLSFAPISEAKRKEYDLFISSMNGSMNTFKFYPYKHVRKGLTDRTVVGYDNVLRSRLIIDNTIGLQVGDFVRVNDQLVQIIRNNVTTIDVAPFIRKNIYPTTLFTSDVYGLFRLENDNNDFVDVNYGNVGSNHQLNATEYI